MECRVCKHIDKQQHDSRAIEGDIGWREYFLFSQKHWLQDWTIYGDSGQINAMKVPHEIVI